eukprot:GFUD01026590.1.p1 GENE.GFUD01026590.1~~GFUD01026590.1.p1  ORF type:complete len:682 (+),score=221.10 GFUD01026590.1:171-2216(+)
MSENRTADLWLKIDQLHLKFLQAEETPAKLEIRKKLEGLVAEYLSLVPQERKFVSASTGDLIVNSAKWKPDFSLVKAANAFRAVEQYAANLINQPWRQEFWSIRQYSGFYKHSVETALSGPEKLFLEMGYSVNPAQAQVLCLAQPRVGEHPVNIDLVTSVARDCVLACVECQLLADIHSGVVTQFPITLDEVVEFRRDHIGSVEVCVRELVYRKNQLRYQFPATSPQYGLQNFAYPGQPQPFHTNNGFPPVGFPGPGQLYPSAMNGFPPASFTDYHHTQFPTSQMNGFPPQSVPPYAAPVNGYGLHQAGPVPGVQAVPGQPGQPVQQPSQAHVPTGRLVELEGGVGGSGQPRHSPAGSSTSTLRQGQIPTTILELSQEPPVPERRGRGEHGRHQGDRERHQERDQGGRHGDQGVRHHAEGGAKPREGREQRERSGKPRNSGKEQDFDSWDYVYKHLEQTGYTKDQAERPDVLEGQQAGGLTCGSQSEREEELRRNIQGLRLREGRNGDTRDVVGQQRESGGGRGGTQQRYSRVETSESEQEAASKYSSAVSEEREPVRQERNARREPPQRVGRGQERGGGQGGAELWECSTCTFHNKQSKTVCEMCSKSRDIPPMVEDKRAVEQATEVRREQKAKSATPPTPPPSGISCAKCTLVNPPSAKICQACDCTLALQTSKSARNC